MILISYPFASLRAGSFRTVRDTGWGHLSYPNSGNCRACARLGQPRAAVPTKARLFLRGRLLLRGRARAPVSPPAYLRHHRPRGRYRIDSEREAIDLADYDAFSGGDGDGGDGVPQLGAMCDTVHTVFLGGRGAHPSFF